MKKALALILSLAMVLCLIPAVAGAVGETATAMTTAPVDGDQVVIYYPAGATAVSNTEYLYESRGYWQLEPVEVTVTEGAMTVPEGAAVLDVTVDENGNYTFVDQNGEYLTAGETGNNLTFEAAASDYSLWIPEDAGNGNFYIKNVNAAYNERPQYLEFYNNFTTYGFNDSNTAIYTFTFFKVEASDPGPIDPPPAEKSDDIVILYSNDVHCGIGEEIEEDGTLVSYSGGYAALAAVKKGLEATHNNVLLVDAGDSIQGAPIGTISRGSYIIDIMNYVGYDVSAVGNHEFDYGMDRFFELEALANFPFVAANFMDLTANEPVLDAYSVFTLGDVKVAFVGISTPETLTKSTPTYFQDAEGNWIYDFANESFETFIAAIQPAIDAAKVEVGETGYVIALAHLGIDPSSTPWTSTEMIAAVSGLDAVIDGHSHSTVENQIVKDKDGNDVVLTQTGTKLENVGKMTITAEGIVTELIPLEEAEVDKDTSDYLVSIASLYNADLQTVVAHTNFDLTVNDPATGSRIIRSQETNLGDLAADAYRDQLDSDIAFVNGGGVRANIPAGDITYGQILTVHPFGNMACLVEVTGQQVLDALEWGNRMVGVGENGGFLQVSGITFEVDPNVENGCVVDAAGMWAGHTGEYRVKNVMVGGEPLDLEAKYTLASHNYMLKSQGDGYAMFGTANVTLLRDEVLIDNQVLINYIQGTLGGEIPEVYANPYGQGRITILPIVEGEPEYDYYIAGDRGYESEFTTDANGNLVFNLTLGELGENELISALEFDLAWDATKLELVSAVANPLTSRNAFGAEVAVNPELNVDAVMPNTSEIYYAVATSVGGWFAEDLSNVVMTLTFQIKDGVADGEQLDVEFTKFKFSVVNSETQTIVDIPEDQVGAYDGYIIVGNAPAPVVDKSALIALDAQYDAVMTTVVASANGMDLTAGTLWLTEAEIATNTAALAASQAVIDNAEATQEEVDAAYQALLAAFIQPKTVVLDYTALNAALAAANEFVASEDFANCSEELQKAWTDAIAAATALIDNPEATQNAINAATDALNALKKTGESATYIIFAGIAVLAMLGMAVVVRRRFN
ncbi:MAG: 5'-nucleotidase C-terminal domain-containing protein [Clostridia bacterium]|nr:5'-nucleotidase C-terminal domain-containing protein [Clostridia bacterium]